MATQRQAHNRCCRLLVVSSIDHAMQACKDVGSFLARGRPQTPQGNRSPACPIIGMWVTAALDSIPGERFGAGVEVGRPGFLFEESIGINGVWSLWWLHVVASGEPPAATLRGSLLESLIHTRSQPESRFAPVFDAGDSIELLRTETARLDQQFSIKVMPPLISDYRNGALYAAALDRSGDD